MGLLYQFPTRDDEQDDRVIVGKDYVEIKSYGLPMVFWGYLAGILFMLAIMILAIKGPIDAILQGDDEINRLIAYAVIALFIGIPISLLFMLFYEKCISRRGSLYKITHKVFWLPYWGKSFEVDQFLIEHMEGSPNIAKLEDRPEMKGFQNRGYFNLFAIDKNQKRILIDRSSQKKTLEQIKELLS